MPALGTTIRLASRACAFSSAVMPAVTAVRRAPGAVLCSQVCTWNTTGSRPTDRHRIPAMHPIQSCTATTAPERPPARRIRAATRTLKAINPAIRTNGRSAFRGRPVAPYTSMGTPQARRAGNIRSAYRPRPPTTFGGTSVQTTWQRRGRVSPGTAGTPAGRSRGRPGC
jgi:hypothetical protein